MHNWRSANSLINGVEMEIAEIKISFDSEKPNCGKRNFMNLQTSNS
jgi:hypothetical protein